MKLSKSDLRLLFAMAQAGAETHEEAILAQNAHTAINNTLEIEGYERADHFANVSKMGWTKFDPNDPKTFPKKKDGRVFLVCFIYNHEQIVEYASFNFSLWTEAEVTHWRPLPKPPVETEGKNDQEF